MYKGECSVEILNVRNSHEHGKMLELCFNLCQKYALIPVVGSGFSFGSPTDNNGIYHQSVSLPHFFLNIFLLILTIVQKILLTYKKRVYQTYLIVSGIFIAEFLKRNSKNFMNTLIRIFRIYLFGKTFNLNFWKFDGHIYLP